MYVSRRARSLSFVLVGGSVPFLLALSLHGQPVSAPAASVPAASTETPRQVADALDKIVQPRFQDMTAGQFGLTRLVPAVRGHQAIGFLGSFRTDTPAEAALLASADSAHRPYVMAFLHCAHVPGQPLPKQSMTMPPDNPFYIPFKLSTIVVSGFPHGYPADYVKATEPVLDQASRKALPGAMKGRNEQTQSGDWTLFLRPVRASQASCLTCHVGAKRGDTLGVMVYAVGNTAKKS